ncbi:MAG: lasso peptide biosynthesis B2 protein [marine benthic group bacterium]|nr:lasso peptide biosynthesis B2 protein [Gemmatimonadota bacterium]
MRKTLKRYRDRSPEERGAVTRAGLLIVTLQAMLRVLPFQKVMDGVYRVARPPASAGFGHGEHSQFDRDLAVWAVEAAGRKLLSRNPCLPKALAVLILFRRAGEPAELRLGVAREADGPVEAHAWIESSGQVVIGGDVPLETYTRLPDLDQKFPGPRKDDP